MNNNNNVRAVSEFRETTDNTIYPIDTEGMFIAYFDCRKGNSRSYCAQQFEAHYEHNIIELCREIRAGLYTPLEFRAFVITKPDYREIFAAQFRH